MLAVGHARDRRDRRRLIDATARAASLARHARTTLAGVGALARATPWPVEMVFADPSAVIANVARHDAGHLGTSRGVGLSCQFAPAVPALPLEDTEVGQDKNPREQETVQSRDAVEIRSTVDG
jgi:hypothetical protein